MSFDAALVAKALAARLADVEAVRDRHVAFAFSPGRPPAPAAPPGGTTEAAARDLVRRALVTLGDPVNDRIALHLAAGDATLGELAEVTGLPHLAVWERVNDLVQVGLARHALDGDRAGLTGAGQALSELVTELAARMAGERAR